jgi:hypothetical protein
MSTLLDTASLIVTPNGYKAGKLYSVVPSSGAGDLDVTRATTATRVNSNGLIESVASNVPRLDYTNGSCPSILVEPQRTNLLAYSEQLDNAGYWTTFNASVTGNTTVSPDGNTTADTITSNASSGGDVYRSIVISGIHTFSAYFKAGSTSLCRLGSTVGGEATFNLSTQTYTLSGGISASIKSVGNGWFYCTLTVNVTATTLVYLSSFDTTGKTVFAWGAQLEAGSYATSYIPTTSASVTRNADVISKTGISSLIGQTEGTMFLDYNKTHASDEALLGMIYLDANPSNNRLQLVIENNHFYMYASNGGALGLLSGNISLSNGRNKIAVSYGSNGYKIYLNGTSVYTNATTLTPSTDSFRLGSYAGGIAVMSDSINQSSLWKTQLTNTQLAQLTTI